MGHESRLKISENLRNTPQQEIPANSINQRLKDINQYEKDAQNVGTDLATYMSGESIIHTNNAHKLILPNDIPIAGNVRSNNSRLIGHSGYLLNTGASYEGFYDNPEMYKFYLSMNEGAKGEDGKSFVKDLFSVCSKQRVTLRIKTLDHNYDSCNIYTTEFYKMEAILAVVYSQYIRLFQEVPRVLQGKVKGIDPLHVSYVQEPARARLYKPDVKHMGSHTSRMSWLGKELQNKGVNKEVYIQTCKDLGIKPSTPWLFEDNALRYDLE